MTVPPTPATGFSFERTAEYARQAMHRDAADPEVIPGSGTRALIHSRRTAKAVLMLHGYTSSPRILIHLAQVFHDRGYNVYVPREPHHGLRQIHPSQVTPTRLMDYATTALATTRGLGDEVGVIGISGGAVLATWLSTQRSSPVSRLLALAPLYHPSTRQAPAYAVRPLLFLYGHRLLPDRRVARTQFTLQGLSQYLKVARRISEHPLNPQLRGVAVAFSSNDPFIDQSRAVEIPDRIARTNGLDTAIHVFEPALALGHNIADGDLLGENAEKVHDLYVRLYEGGQ